MKKELFTLILIPFVLFYAFPAGAVEKEERKWQDETIYYIMVDRFSNIDSNNDFVVDADDPMAYHGGDFKGIIDRLDYLKEMGFTALRLTPVFDNEAGGYHGYLINDFYKTEEHFGTINEFKQLVKEAHDRDMKIILDFVVNQVGPNHEWTNDPEKQDWFQQKQEMVNVEDKEARENGQLNGMPDLDQDHPEVRKYLLDAATWWIEETDIDGYGLDAVDHVPISFWEDFAKEIKQKKEDFYLIGEISSDDPNEIAEYKKTGIDGFVDYPLNNYLREAFAKPDQSLGTLFSAWEQHQESYDNSYLMGTFMDNDQTARFTRDIIKNEIHPGPRWKLALTYLYTTPGIPIVYYGSEIALDGGDEPDNHRQMDFRTDKELVDYITKLGELRDQYPSLTRGTIELLFEDKGMVVYKRTSGDETSVIAINNSSETKSAELEESSLDADKELRGLLNGDLIKSSEGQYKLVLDREEAEIYFLTEKTGLNIPYLTVMGAVYAAFIVFIILVWKRSRRKSS
ncbi:alpha-amylase family glycosyl hydrolase [Bacillus canaveralius]|uniref:alpha-amylase family glycosyl hydrolase n=1 Tax=Bacillus canaveralius TaxID=1403243 RepID=UPI000F7B296E|nr:alpha-amylase family glycosyl hydrolase [Bacillus canaveralius]RSK46912.1 alpha-amlyase [Bacillus canaveralius]